MPKRTPTTKTARRDSYEAVTARIIEALEAGVVPWAKPWRNVAGDGPTRLATGKAYRGINLWTLSVTSLLEGYSSPYWATFNQVKSRGGNVRRGEKGTQVTLWKPVDKRENEAGEETHKRYLMLRHYTVFNLDQCDGIEGPKSEPLPECDPIASAEAVVVGYVPGPDISHGGNRAYYSPALDSVRMPHRGQFTSSEGYYATLFHELAHSTGHESRLNRETLIAATSFGDEEYSKEELIAELASALVCGEAGIAPNVPQSASYCASWLRVLKDDRKLLVQAAGKAQRAADLILGHKPEASSEETTATETRELAGSAA